MAEPAAPDERGETDESREPDAPRIGRRALLIGGIGVVAVGAAAVIAAVAGSGGGGSANRPTPTPTPTPTVTRNPDLPEGFDGGEFVSAARKGARTEWGVYYPKGHDVGASLPVLVVLHGYGDGPREAFERIHLDQALDQVVGAGATPFAVAAVDGGTSFWHPRATGEDAGAMVTDEFLPLLSSLGLQTDRIALLGWSMGGFGALLLASQLGPDRVAAVVAESPAVWPEYIATDGVAFDDAADFEEHGLFGRQELLDGIPVRIDCGTSDEFYPTTKAYVAGFASPPAGGFQDGSHNFAYWAKMAPEQLAFVAEQF